jgi:hypothetical protein
VDVQQGPCESGERRHELGGRTAPPELGDVLGEGGVAARQRVEARRKLVVDAGNEQALERRALLGEPLADPAADRGAGTQLAPSASRGLTMPSVRAFRAPPAGPRRSATTTSRRTRDHRVVAERTGRPADRSAPAARRASRHALVISSALSAPGSPGSDMPEEPGSDR